MRLLYNFLTWLLLIPYAGYFVFRALFNSTYRPGLGQRFGFGYPSAEKSIWVHAVSVGEVVAAAPLIRALMDRYPEYRMLVTTVTPTGATRVRALFGESVAHSYIPFETPYAIRRFFASVRPEIALIMETEIWPNLYQGCGRRKIPLVLVSARISPRSVERYRMLLPLFRETLSHGIVIAAQSKTDAERFLSLGAAPERTRVTGNIKFDIELPDRLSELGQNLKREMLGGRPAWIAASTHEGEEEQVLDAHERVRRQHPELLLVLVPRHPERFDAVRELLERRRLQYVARTSGKPAASATSVILGDTMGEVTLFYAACDIAFVGGSLVPIGGHNLLEPAAVGVPILAGPHNFNAPEIVDRLLAEQACRIVADSEELAATIDRLLCDEQSAASLVANATRILENNRGALDSLLDLIKPLVGDAVR